MSLFSASRCVLLLTDEGLGIYDTGGNRVQILDSIPWETEDFEEAVAEVIKKRSRSKSILILNDMVEQHYRKERVPKASPFDRANIIRHRVSAAFPAFPIRSAIKLKEKPAQKEGETGGGDVYLFGAVPYSDNIRRVLSAVKKSFRPIAGFCLLPVESASMVHTLSRKISKASDKPPMWTIFVGQHRNGGLRQIVTKNGELALTRMTPISDNDADSDNWASDVVGELRGTMSYLTRFGFDPRSGLDVIVVANNSVADKIESRIDFDCNLNVLTAIEVANFIGARIGRQEDQKLADAIHIAWAGAKPSFTMPLQAAEIDSITGPAKMATVASLLMVAGCCYFAYDAYVQASDLSKAKEDISGAKQTLTRVQQDHAAETERQKEIGVDFPLIETSTKIFGALEKMSMKPLSVLDGVGKALGPDLRLTSMSIKPVAETTVLPGTAVPQPAAQGEVPGEEKPKQYELIISLKFPATLAPEVGVRNVEELRGRIAANLPDHEVTIIKQVADLTYTGNFVGEVTSQTTKPKDVKEDYEAQIMVKGSML